MNNISSEIRDTIPISVFNRGLAGKVFEEVKHSGAKVVMKNNTAECVLVAPEEYVKILDEINDARLLVRAAERMAAFDPSLTVTEEDVIAELGLTEGDLKGYEEVELE